MARAVARQHWRAALLPRRGDPIAGVLGGIAARERLLAAMPDAVIDSLAELPALVERWAR